MPVTTATIIPANDTTDLAYDLLKHFVAQILRGGTVANFVNGWDGNDSSLVADTINLYPGFLEDGPPDAGMVWAQEGEALGSEPFRNARATVILRCKDDAQGTGYSGRQKAHAAANAIEQFLKPTPGYERTCETLPSGRRVLAFENVTRSVAGRDASQRDQVVIEFTMRIQEAGTP